MKTWINPACDRSEWPAGAWNDEPFDKAEWRDDATGLTCLAKRRPLSGHWCGYVGVRPGHPWHGGTDVDVEVHGGVTYGAACEVGERELGICHEPAPGEPDELWWLGFDCAHAGDASPGMIAHRKKWGIGYDFSDETYRSFAYVRNQCARLAAQAKELMI